MKIFSDILNFRTWITNLQTVTYQHHRIPGAVTHFDILSNTAKSRFTLRQTCYMFLPGSVVRYHICVCVCVYILVWQTVKDHKLVTPQKTFEIEDHV